MLIMLMIPILSSAQEFVTVKFTATSSDSIYHPFNNIIATNLTRGWTETLDYPDTVLVLLNSVGVAEHINTGLGLRGAYPNPFTDKTHIILELYENCEVLMQVVCIDGTKVVVRKQYFEAGSYNVTVGLSSPQMAYFVVTTPNGQEVVKLLHFGQSGTNSIDVDLLSVFGSSLWKTNAKHNALGEFAPGDVMCYKAQFNIDNMTITSEIVVQPQYDDDTIALVFSDPMGASNGKFTINSSGDQVYFSRGNLQYNAVLGTHMVYPWIGNTLPGIWRFAVNQYDYIGDANQNISSSYNGWIDLFGWATSGWPCGNRYYEPWDSDNNDGSHYGPPPVLGYYNLTGNYAQSDWGIYNEISNGGDYANQWRTLTKEEWKYVFNTRNTNSGIRYAKAQIIDENNEIINGMILLPDDWDTSYYALCNTNISDAGFSSNVISYSSWENGLETFGAVFLPAAGKRDGTLVKQVGSFGYYWSVSYHDGDGAYLVSFGEIPFNPNVSSYRYFGYSVRLVSPIDN